MPDALSRTRRRTTLARLVAGAAVGAMAFLPVSPVSAAPPAKVPLAALSGELVQNGGAQAANADGWTGDLLVRGYSTGGFPGPVVLPLPGTQIPDAGAQFFGGVGAASQAYQDIDLSAAASAIDNGVVIADLSAYLGGYASQEDRAEVSYEFFDASNNLVDTVVLPTVTLTDRESESGFLHRTDSLTLDPGVRSVRVTFGATRSTAPANDGYVDNISLKLFAPGPEAVADSPTTVQDQPVTFSPADNDEPPTGATIDSTSVRLLDGNGDPVTTLTNSDGTYTVDTATGKITFTPASGFTGTATPVDYQITDSNGQTGTATITVTVGPLVGVSLINGSSAVGLLALVVLGSGVIAAVRRRRSVNG